MGAEIGHDVPEELEGVVLAWLIREVDLWVAGRSSVRERHDTARGKVVQQFAERPEAEHALIERRVLTQQRSLQRRREYGVAPTTLEAGEGLRHEDVQPCNISRRHRRLLDGVVHASPTAAPPWCGFPRSRR